MTTVHLIYPHGNRISCPDAIGRNVAKYLTNHGYAVMLYDWDKPGRIMPGGDDVLLGHPHPISSTVFRKSVMNDGWKRRIAMFPVSPGDPIQNAFEDAIVPNCNLVLAITGNYWYERIAESPFSHWLPKTRHLDLAVDQSDFPPLKRHFNPVGKRKFLYIGHDAWYKNTKYLSDIAEKFPNTEFAWMGRSVRNQTIEGLIPLGRRDFGDQGSREILAEYDFCITVGRADANPTTILEAMAWGLIPVSSKESGYFGFNTIPTIPLDSIEDAADIVNKLQNLPDGELAAMQQSNWQLLDSHFNWARFGDQVIDAIESDANPPCGPQSTSSRLRLRFDAMRSPYSQFGFKHVKMLARRRLKQWT